MYVEIAKSKLKLEDKLAILLGLILLYFNIIPTVPLWITILSM